MELGNHFYFVAASGVTDSAKTSAPNGRMIIGREMDDSIIQTMEKNLGCSIDSIITADHKNSYAKEPVSLENSSYQSKDNDMVLTFLVSNLNEKAPSIQVTLRNRKEYGI